MSNKRKSVHDHRTRPSRSDPGPRGRGRTSPRVRPEGKASSARALTPPGPARERARDVRHGRAQDALQEAPIGRHGEVQFGRFRILVSDLVAEVERRTSDLSALAEKVEFRADDEPILNGTAIEVYRIAALLEGGASIKEVLEDYPSLSAGQVETARAYAEAYPKPGRPYPRTSVKRALAGAGLEALDDA